jgi:predicted transcriptional regulator
MRNISNIIQSIKDYKGLRSNRELAKFLGITAPAIANWIARDTLDEQLIQSKIPEIRQEWLRTGELPMTEQSDIINILMRRIEYLERRIEFLEKNGQ